MSTDYNFETQLIIPDNRDNVFQFFSQAVNLQVLTPEWLHFKILTPPPIEMKAGTLIDYRLRLYGVPLYWRTKITVWEPPLRFIDEQIKGPYSKWVHEHRFTPQGDQTLMQDHVTYALPLFSSFLNRVFVRKNVERIFSYRTEKITGVFSDKT